VHDCAVGSRYPVRQPPDNAVSRLGIGGGKAKPRGLVMADGFAVGAMYFAMIVMYFAMSTMSLVGQPTNQPRRKIERDRTS
jgi:hypothetical protein